MQLFVSIGSMLATSVLRLFLRNLNLSLGFASLLFICLGVVVFTLLLLLFVVVLQRRNLRHEEEAPVTQNLNEGVAA